MNKDKLNEIFSISLGILSFIAIISLLVRNNFDTNELLGAIIDLTQVAVPVLVLLIALAINKNNKSIGQVAKETLIKLQKENKDLLIGPRYNRENYDTENGKGLEYLFVKNEDPNSKLKTKFIPIQNLNEGVLAIYIQKGTLVHSLKYKSEQATASQIKIIQSKIHNSVKEYLEKNYSGYFDVLESKRDDTAIIVDFDEVRMGKKRYAKVVYACAKNAIGILKDEIKN